MPINISAPVQISVNQDRPQTSINIAGETSSINSPLGITAGVGNSGISPAPVIQVNVESASDNTVLESPFIAITQRSSETNNSSNQDFSRPVPADNTLQQVRELVQQQQSIQTRKDQLQSQEDAIEKEISQLQQKELEINRKRFQLQQQSTGNIVNIRI